MDVNPSTISAAMNCVAACAIEDIAEEADLPLEKAAADFLSSQTACRLFDDSTKLWWEGPSNVVQDYWDEVRSDVL